MSKIYSFDVFDTLITRTVCLPEYFFLQVARRINTRLGLNLDPVIIAILRIMAERELLETGTFPNIQVIYDRLASKLNLPSQPHIDQGHGYPGPE